MSAHNASPRIETSEAVTTVLGNHPLFAFGFRPFFLLAALAAVLLLPLWSVIYAGVYAPPIYFAAPIWHGHEMVFGFTAAVIAGFFLTAVPNWTGIPAHKGRVLIGLAGLWLAGRVVVLFGGWLPAWLVALVDVAFFPALMAAITPALIRTGNRRNMLFPHVLVVFAAANLFVHLGAMQILDWGAEVGLKVAVDLVTLLMVVIGGRVVPNFTAGALRSTARAPNWTDRAAPLAMVAVAVLDLWPSAKWLPGAAALAAAIIVALRMRGWQSFKTLNSPILWVLHLGYAWVVIGLAFKSFALLTELLRWQDAVHGLSAGAIGTLTLGMMSRVALGHTGRPLQVRPVIALAYVLVSIATILRLATLLAPSLSTVLGMTHLASALWATAFFVYLVVYTPILTRPRADGRPG